jgi:hypothetical protein
VAHRIAAFESLALEWSKKALWEIPVNGPDWMDALKLGKSVGDQIQAGRPASGSPIAGLRPGH